MNATQKTYKGRTVTEVVVYPYTPDNARGVRYGYAIGHDGADFVGGAHRTLSAAVKAATRFATEYGVQVTDIRVD